MWQRYTFEDFRTIAHYLGTILVMGGFAMLAPFIVAIFFGEWDAARRYLIGTGISLISGGALRLSLISPGQMTRHQALAVTGFAWIALSLVGAIPLFLSSHYSLYTDALFDSVSAFTTTDATLVSDINHLSHADNMWRFTMNFFGGLGLVVVAISLGLFSSVSGSNMYSSEGRSEHVLPNVVQTARFILRFTLVIIAIMGACLATVLVIGGFPAPTAILHGIWLAMSAFMTAGATPMSTGVVYYHNFALEILLMVIMIMGSISMVIQSEIRAGRTESFSRDSEVHMGIVWWLVTLGIFVASMCGTQISSPLPMLMRTGLFSFVAAATTTGFVDLNTSQAAAVLPSGAILLLTLVMAVGGSAGSTAGGIKLQRLSIIAKAALETVKNTASSESVRLVTDYYHIGRRHLEAPEIREAMTVFIMFIAMYIIGAMVGIAFGYDALTSITESVAMASNSGISAGISQVGMPLFLKMVYILEMWMGRLEYVALIALAVKIFVSLKPDRNILKKKDKRR